MWAFCDTSGIIIGDKKYLNAEDFSDGVARVRVLSGWGYITPDGTFIIQPKYDFAGNFSNGIGRVKMISNEVLGIQSNIWLYIDKEGKTLFTNLKIEKAEDFSNGLGRVRIDGRWGFIDATGEISITPQFENCLDFTLLGN